MGLQYIGPHIGYVVEFEELPALPITGIGVEKIYARALTDAIETKLITEGGKYFITLPTDSNRDYEIARVIE